MTEGNVYISRKYIIAMSEKHFAWGISYPNKRPTFNYFFIITHSSSYGDYISRKYSILSNPKLLRLTSKAELRDAL